MSSRRTENQIIIELLKRNNNEVNDQALDKEIRNDRKDQLNPTDELLMDIKKSSLENHELKRKLKKKFFNIVMSMYIIVILGSIAAIIITPIMCSGWVEIVSTVLSAVVSIVTSLIKIPNIIAEYLFPKGEDDLLITLSKNAQKHEEVLQRFGDKQKKDDKQKEE